MPDSATPTRRIVCAANKRHFSGEIVLGIRHFDQLMHQHIDLFDNKHTQFAQGFVDQQGNFLTRTEAWQVAKAANQIIRRVGGDETDGGTLYSENLY